jgi:hypothetical protein
VTSPENLVGKNDNMIEKSAGMNVMKTSRAQDLNIVMVFDFAGRAN